MTASAATTPAPTLCREGELLVLDLGSSENKINPAWLDGVERALEAALDADAPRALVTVAEGKFFSTGLDLEWLGANGGAVEGFVARWHGLFARVLAAGVPTVAAVQGHAFAGGAMFALTHDQIVMREDRGFFCLPEVDLGIPFTPGLTALIRARLAPRVAHEAMTTGRRYTGPEALAAGIVDELAPVGGVREAAFARAEARAGSDARTLGLIKSRLYAEAVAALQAKQEL